MNLLSEKYCYLCLSILISCSSIQFTSSHDIPVSFSHEESHVKDLSVKVSKSFYMWGLVPPEQTVYVDKLFLNEGAKSVASLKIKEIETTQKALWMIVTFGMYYPQSYLLSAEEI